MASSMGARIRHREASSSDLAIGCQRMHREKRARTEKPRFDEIVMGKRPPKKKQQARWATRGAKAKLTTEPHARAKREEKERERWVHQLGLLLRRAQLPIVAKATASLNPEKAMGRAAGGARAGTIRGCVRSVKKFLDWRSGPHVHSPWPSSDVEIGDYLEMRASEPCGRSVPRSFLSSLAFFG